MGGDEDLIIPMFLVNLLQYLQMDMKSMILFNFNQFFSLSLEK